MNHVQSFLFTWRGHFKCSSSSRFRYHRHHFHHLRFLVISTFSLAYSYEKKGKKAGFSKNNASILVQLRPTFVTIDKLNYRKTSSELFKLYELYKDNKKTHKIQFCCQCYTIQIELGKTSGAEGIGQIAFIVSRNIL